MNNKIHYTKLTGFIAAPFTPMNTDGSVNLPVISSYAEYLKGLRLTGIFINGTTGEGLSLSVEERKQIAEEWIKNRSKKLKIIVHIGSTSLKECIELSQHASSLGAYAIGIMGPIFFKPDNVDDLVAFLARIAESAVNTPLYYYHIPSMSGVNVPIPDLLEKAKTKIPTLVGVKFTHNDLMEFNQCMMVDGGNYDILHGYDETLLCGLTLGANAAVGSTYNYYLPVYKEMVNAFHAGDLDSARKEQQKSVKLVEILNKYGGGVSCGKAIMNLIGINCGPCRLPLHTLTKTQISSLIDDLKDIDFFKNDKHNSMIK